MFNSIIKRINIPNTVSISRIPLAIAIVYSFSNVTSLVLLCIAALTDYLDGLLARILNKQSSFGEKLDPFCDKLFVAIVCLSLGWNVPFTALFFASFFLRDIVVIVTLTVLFVSKCNSTFHLRSLWFGKVVTTFQFIALIVLLLEQYELLKVICLILVLSSIASIIEYLIAFIHSRNIQK
ncbi:CDP-alcohol phosphatidyltransferase family protein [Candidatus Peregrinibacteria bacterium]|jgi:CDP-diacylglycerol--glycerol-3-phosphate 3-phosphatidyltransferase|nr:CDP-alcohol phosphatidyltransferase family protein [Candidatus Peregrinibacteria bacterium]MBT3598473.1 CDP-alcohol phosphatidyltransferase family protein [Candidatus Peregrinibacteria bacterium]MBT4367134.1 CDP-alcohol phosphatidyltransferase family protein [Candidatus Peregrinibacteria bacterium]MBT4586003.1 CDP-alcohol phosphatidyltransferase family protein [Candidatus Peregrinibacteria bacterium]MBT6730858.1 CDP-alcohol phosphatidyltransferase family protein [Candidatus Peregrinibacteria